MAFTIVRDDICVHFKRSFVVDGKVGRKRLSRTQLVVVCGFRMLPEQQETLIIQQAPIRLYDGVRTP